MARVEPVANVEPAELSTEDVEAEFKALLRDGFRLVRVGQAKNKAPGYLLRTRPPRHRIDLFDVQIYLSDIRRDDGFRYFVAYLILPQGQRNHRKRIYPRIFYKDSSLIWRSPSHYIGTAGEKWVGKGDIKPVIEHGQTNWYSAEETTNLPLEMDAALDTVSRRVDEVVMDPDGLPMVLRNGPEGRVEPYADFSGPRKQAMAIRKRQIHRNRDIAWFDNESKPTSLKFAPGFQPDFAQGLIGHSESWSKLYGGPIDKYRFASVNRQVQYLFIHGPHQVWIIPPQPFDDELSSYGVRTVDANVDERLCIPGFEFHYLEEDGDPDSLHSQIPPNFVGPPSEIDPDRADASPWNDKMPVIGKFRRWHAKWGQ